MILVFFAFLKKEYEAKRPLLGNKEDSNLKVIDFKFKKMFFQNLSKKKLSTANIGFDQVETRKYFPHSPNTFGLSTSISK